MTPGQTFPIAQAMLVIVDHDGVAHAWEIRDGLASWRFTGHRQGNSTAHVEIDGVMKRRSQPFTQDELNPQRKGLPR